MARGFDGLRQRRRGHRTGPEPQFAALDDFALRGWFHLQHNSPRRGGGFELLSARNTRRPPQIKGQDDAIGAIELHDCCHGKSMAWLWRGCKFGDIQAGIRRQVMAELRAHVCREFLNRVDDTHLLDPLTRADLKTIVELQLIAGEATDHSRVTVESMKGELVSEMRAAKKQALACRRSAAPRHQLHGTNSACPTRRRGLRCAQCLDINPNLSVHIS